MTRKGRRNKNINKLVEGDLGFSLAAAPKSSPQQSLLRDGLRSRGGKAGLCTRTTNGDYSSKHHPTFAFAAFSTPRHADEVDPAKTPQPRNNNSRQPS